MNFNNLKKAELISFAQQLDEELKEERRINSELLEKLNQHDEQNVGDDGNKDKVIKELREECELYKNKVTNKINQISSLNNTICKLKSDNQELSSTNKELETENVQLKSDKEVSRVKLLNALRDKEDFKYHLQSLTSDYDNVAKQLADANDLIKDKDFELADNKTTIEFFDGLRKTNYDRYLRMKKIAIMLACATTAFAIITIIAIIF